MQLLIVHWSSSYEDTCSFTCNTSYELTGSDTRTCQSNGKCNGSDVICRKCIKALTDSNDCPETGYV